MGAAGKHRAAGSEQQSRKGPSLLTRAVAILARREHSRTELAAKLRPHLEASDDLDAVLDRLEAKGLLSTTRFAAEYATVRGRKMSSARVAQELKQKGVDATAVEAATAQLDDDATLRSIWAKKFGTYPTTGEDTARQVRFLQSRGFGVGRILRFLKAEGTANE